MTAIVAAGSAAPALRLQVSDVNAAWGRKGGRGQVAACAADEDPLTLAWDAATAALRAAELDGGDIDGLWWGTTRPPFAEGPSHAYLAASLSLRPSATGALLSGSPHAGIDALLAAADAIAAGRVHTALVIASDALAPALGSSLEPVSGAGAVALVLAAGDGPARIVRSATHVRPTLDRYRGDSEAGSRDTYDGRLFRESVFVPALAELGRALSAPNGTRWSVPDPDGRLGNAAAKALGIAPGGSAVSPPVRSALGDLAAAAAVAGGVGALTEPGSVTFVGWGGGRASAVLVHVDQPVPGAADAADALAAPGRPASYADVLRARGQLRPEGETVEMAVPPGSAMLVRGAVEILGLEGARCADCGTVNTPPSIHPHCIACGSDKFDIVALARTGTVHTFVVNHTMPAPFVAPLGLAVLDLDDGARLMLQVAGDPSELAIGSTVELVLRRYTIERGAPVYGYKARVVIGLVAVPSSEEG